MFATIVISPIWNSPRRVAGAARGAAELLADPGPGEAGVGGHAVLDLVAEVDANTAVARGGLL
ncbi:MAG TPA: hypothetical protein VHJ39_08040 [Solirubrobacteraceae bacterium]|nr:hypothetical protein [Solirubrobacteraceae bacterium]